jgi:hypothetical protein
MPRNCVLVAFTAFSETGTHGDSQVFNTELAASFLAGASFPFIMSILLFCQIGCSLSTLPNKNSGVYMQLQPVWSP